MKVSGKESSNVFRLFHVLSTCTRDGISLLLSSNITHHTHSLCQVQTVLNKMEESRKIRSLKLKCIRKYIVRRSSIAFDEYVVLVSPLFLTPSLSLSFVFLSLTSLSPALSPMLLFLSTLFPLPTSPPRAFSLFLPFFCTAWSPMY